jgi:hypothetical protein
MEEVAHINPNGLARSIKEWAKILFKDANTGEVPNNVHSK